MSLISIIVPTHNERANVGPLYQRLKAVFEGLEEHDFELIFCDDSRDETPQEIARLNALDRRVKLIRLARRFSQPVAITAGLDRASGAAAILMDADLQDPPEAIPQLLALWKQGNEVVYVERSSASNYALYKLFSVIFYRLLKRMSSVEIPLDAGEFRLLDRKVIEFLSRLTEHTRYYRGLTVWPGLRQAKIRIQRAPRHAGKTNYSFRRSLMIAIDGWVSFSLVPLRVVAVIGAVVTVASLLIGTGYGIARVLGAPFGRGWAGLFAGISFLGGLQLLALGVIGEYVGRIFVEAQNRPLYWVDYELGFTDRPPG